MPQAQPDDEQRTQIQTIELRRMGYTEEEVRNMDFLDRLSTLAYASAMADHEREMLASHIAASVARLLR